MHVSYHVLFFQMTGREFNLALFPEMMVLTISTLIILTYVHECSQKFNLLLVNQNMLGILV